MTTVEGVTLREAVEWCGDQIGVREATRLRRLAENNQDAEKGDEDGATALRCSLRRLRPMRVGSECRYGGWMTQASRRKRRRSRTRGCSRVRAALALCGVRLSGGGAAWVGVVSSTDSYVDRL